MSQTETLIKDFGFSHFGFAELKKPLSFEFYQTWVGENLNGSMEYLKNHLEIKKSPQQLWPRAQSAIVIAQNYFPHPEPLPTFRGKVALYARGKDYHYFFLEKLNALQKKLESEFPQDFFFSATDSQPILERDLGYRAGLGFVGKNTCLIHPQKGSLFFIGEILTSLHLDQASVLMPDRCGTCTRCIDICPTQALIEPRKLDARRCLSYLNIEAQNDPDIGLRPLMKDWLFGCDLCQTVCPWNEKAFGSEIKLERQKHSSREDLISDIEFLLNSSNREIEERLRSTPLLRAGAKRLRRTALILSANHYLYEMIPAVRRAADKYPHLKEIAHWTLSMLESEK